MEYLITEKIKDAIEHKCMNDKKKTFVAQKKYGNKKG